MKGVSVLSAIVMSVFLFLAVQDILNSGTAVSLIVEFAVAVFYAVAAIICWRIK